MTDFAISVFHLANSRGYLVPPLNIAYVEKGTGAEWRINCRGTRAYLVRYGTPLTGDRMEQAADSHFMIRRVTSSLLLGGMGLFQPEPTGRLLFSNVEGQVAWDCYFDQPDLRPKRSSMKRLTGWYQALCTHTVLRRAADDVHLALSHPHEALVFIYRGFEWLVVGQMLKWDDIAADCGVPVANIRELKKAANVDTGVRHASFSGRKVRAARDNYGTWACGLMEAINSARERLEPGYKRMTQKEVADAVFRAIPLVPYV